MHVGYSAIFQNPRNARSDFEVYTQELRLAEMAEPLGFDSIWSVEHHFTDYTMVPDVTQFLSYMAGKTSRIQLGSAVIVLPWHDPVRVAEEVAMLDNLSGGRFILGIGRGLGRIEFEGFRLDMGESRERFIEYAEMILTGLERGYVEYDGKLIKQPRRDIRPAPFRSFRGRTYAAAVSPESMPIMARLGVGLLVIVQKPWEDVAKDFETYHRVWAEVNGNVPPPKPQVAGFFFVDSNADRAEEMAHRYIGDYYRSVMRHYEMTGDHFGQAHGYEYYKAVSKYINRHGRDGAAESFANLMPWGTPDQVIEKLSQVRKMVDMSAVHCTFSYSGMPYDEAERSMRLFVKEVMPELKRWQTDPLPKPAELTLLTAARAG